MSFRWIHIRQQIIIAILQSSLLQRVKICSSHPKKEAQQPTNLTREENQHDLTKLHSINACRTDSSLALHTTQVDVISTLLEIKLTTIGNTFFAALQIKFLTLLGTFNLHSFCHTLANKSGAIGLIICNSSSPYSNREDWPSSTINHYPVWSSGEFVKSTPYPLH